MGLSFARFGQSEGGWGTYIMRLYFRKCGVTLLKLRRKITLSFTLRGSDTLISCIQCIGSLNKRAFYPKKKYNPRQKVL